MVFIYLPHGNNVLVYIWYVKQSVSCFPSLTSHVMLALATLASACWLGNECFPDGPHEPVLKHARDNAH
jgi:hypothetical protein